MTERYKWKAAIIAAFLIFSGIHATTGYASIGISPVRVDLSNDHNKDVVRISNQETTAKSYEVEVVAWSQTEEKREVYAPTEDILAVPPLFTLNPGEEQIVRIGMLTDADINVERSYRMFITELAPPTPEETQGSVINMRLQIGVPVFIAPVSMPNANLNFVESTQAGDQFFMRFRNSGNTHVKVTEVHYSAPGSEGVVVTPAVVYILAGQSGYLPVELPGGNQVGTITIVTENLGAMEYELPFAP